MEKIFTLENLIMVGFDYKNSPLEVREKVYFTFKNLKNAYKRICSENNILESVILSTCNRSEIYSVVEDIEQGKAYFKSFYADFFHINPEILEKYFLFRSAKEVVYHLFEVACGFQSLVLGEDQILGQVKKSYETALEYESTGKVLNRLFLDSITSSKKIKTETGISENSISISSVGVKLLNQKLKDLTHKRALVIGLGKMSKITVKKLFEDNIGKIYVTNRTRRKVTDFAKEFSDDKSKNIVEIDFHDRYSVVNDVDIIVSCTSAPHVVFHRDKFDEIYSGQPICMLDLAVPRDIDPELGNYKNIDLYRLDDLDAIVQENIERRLMAKDQGQLILEQNVRKFIKWTEEFKIIDLIVNIQEASKQRALREIEDIKANIGQISQEQMEIIEKSFINTVKALTHQQVMTIKKLAGQEDIVL